MGIFGLYPLILRRYPLSRKRFNPSQKTNCQCLYIDANGLLYEVPSQEVNDEIFKHHLALVLDHIVHQILPTDLIFISIFGTAILARYTGVKLSAYESPERLKRRFFGFRPGTKIMDEITEYLKEFINKKRSIDPAWSKPDVIFSTSYTPGEGEIKMFDHIRQLPPTSGNIFVYSEDSDICMLALLHPHHIIVMRQRQTGGGFHEETFPRVIKDFPDYELIFMDIIKEYMELDFNPDDFHALAQDFVVLGCLTGNDYIPGLPFVNFKSMSDPIINSYKSVAANVSSHLIVNGSINRQFLIEFLTAISAKMETMSAEPFEAFFEPTEELLRDLGRNYVTMLEFVPKLYSHGTPSWTYSFRYPILPIIPVLIPYLDVESEEYSLGEPIPPYLQTLYGPPSALLYAPPQIAALMTPDSPVGVYFPSDPKYYSYGYPSAGKSIPIIPPVDYDVMLQYYNEAIGKMSEEELKYNHIEGNIVYGGGEKEQLPLYSAPTLHSVQISAHVGSIKKHTERFPSSRQSVVLTLAENTNNFVADNGQWVLAGYPYLEPTKVVGESRKSVGELIKELKVKQGIIVNGETHGLSVMSLEGERFDVISSLVFPFDGRIERFLNNSTKPLHVGSPVAIVLGQYQGKSGVVLRINGNTADIKVVNTLVTASTQCPLQSDRVNWIKLGELARPLGASIRTLRAVVGGITVYDSEGEDFQVGLKLRMFGAQEHIEYWIKSVDNESMYNSDLQPLLEEYFRQSGNLKNYLNNRLKTANIRDLHIASSDLFTTDSDDRFYDFYDWLEEKSPTAYFSLVSDSWSSVSFKTLRKLEEWMMGRTERDASFVVNNVPIEQLAWPGSKLEVDHSRLKVGERIVAAPAQMIEVFGKTGYVVAKNGRDREVMVLFNEEVEWGTDIRGRMKSFRLVKLKYDEFIASN